MCLFTCTGLPTPVIARHAAAADWCGSSPRAAAASDAVSLPRRASSHACDRCGRSRSGIRYLLPVLHGVRLFGEIPQFGIAEQPALLGVEFLKFSFQSRPAVPGRVFENTQDNSLRINAG